MATAIEEFGLALQQHAPEFAVQLDEDQIVLLKRYYALLLKWNARLHLVAPCSPEEFALRHVLESLLLLKHLPKGAAVVDVGSGGGLPMIPCLLVRDDLHATMIESSQKKAVFLREALKLLRAANPAEVLTARFEDLSSPPVDFLTCRALERFVDLLPKLVEWVPRNSSLLLFGSASLAAHLGRILASVTTELIPSSERRFLIKGRRET
jgi:16S rRNA (guanine(527)-N(7))-methyltransferase RsmG